MVEDSVPSTSIIFLGQPHWRFRSCVRAGLAGVESGGRHVDTSRDLALVRFHLRATWRYLLYSLLIVSCFDQYASDPVSRASGVPAMGLK